MTIGHGNPIVVQSMCATKTTDVGATVAQAEALREAPFHVRDREGRPGRVSVSPSEPLCWYHQSQGGFCRPGDHPACLRCALVILTFEIGGPGFPGNGRETDR